MSDIVNYYQSIPELRIKGRMNTPQEFERIGLPKDLKDKNVLDVGCNTGAFLLECERRGAALLIGIEPNDDWRWLACGILKENIHPDRLWNVYPYIDIIEFGQYDLVLLLSILHLIDNPNILLVKAYEKTKRGGLLIVEINDRLQKIPITIPKGGRLYGKNKDGRSVWHCKK